MLPCFETQYMFKGLIILGRAMIKDSKSHVILELKLAVLLWQHEMVTVSSRVYFCLNVSLPQLICAVTPPYKSTVHSRKWQLERWHDLSLRLTTLQLPAGQLELEKWSRSGGDDSSLLTDFGSLHLDVSRPPVVTCLISWGAGISHGAESCMPWLPGPTQPKPNWWDAVASDVTAHLRGLNTATKPGS